MSDTVECPGTVSAHAWPGAHLRDAVTAGGMQRLPVALGLRPPLLGRAHPGAPFLARTALLITAW